MPRSLPCMLLASSLSLLGCGTPSGSTTEAETSSGDGDGDGDGDGETTGGYPEPDPASACEGRLEPLPPTGLIETVGDGTPASCTEQALHDAVAAVNAASGGGTVNFDCGGPHTIELSSSVFVSNTMILDGAGGIALSGASSVRVIELDHMLDFVLQNLTIQDGYVPAGAENESGAGLLSPWFGTLKIIDCVFDNNESASLEHDVGGGALYAGGLTEALISGSVFVNNRGSTGGAILNRSSNLRVIDSVFTDNRATSEGEGQYGNGGGLYIDRMWLDAPIDFVICGAVFERNHATVHGSALFSYNLEGGGATIDRCTFRDNDMADSVGGGTGSVYHQGVPLLLINSSFADNSTGAHAGGLFLGGGTNAVVRNCSFDGNHTPGNAGALWAGSGSVEVFSSTFSNNRADYGPVIFKGQDGAVTLTNVLFANNGTDNEFSALACHETFTDGGGNMQWPDVKNNGNPDTPCAASIVLADPLLEPLADNGGSTATAALGSGSPAIDAGVATGCPLTDQRGEPRDDGACDIGAFEVVE